MGLCGTVWDRTYEVGATGVEIKVHCNWGSSNLHGAQVCRVVLVVRGGGDAAVLGGGGIDNVVRDSDTVFGVGLGDFGRTVQQVLAACDLGDGEASVAVGPGVDGGALRCRCGKDAGDAGQLGGDEVVAHGEGWLTVVEKDGFSGQ